MSQEDGFGEHTRPLSAPVDWDTLIADATQRRDESIARLEGVRNDPTFGIQQAVIRDALMSGRKDITANKRAVDEFVADIVKIKNSSRLTDADIHQAIATEAASSPDDMAATQRLTTSTMLLKEVAADEPVSYMFDVPVE